MNIYQAKQIQIEDFLRKLGHEPVKVNERCLWYLSPFREEKTPSFNVHVYMNVWYDHGIGRGGNIIDLAKELYRIEDLSTLLRKIESLAPPMLPQKYQAKRSGCKREETFKRVTIVSLTHHLLIDYLSSRNVDYRLAIKVCKEIHYYCNGVPYYAIAFPNIKGGYEIRNRLFKGCISPKAISIFSTDNERSTDVVCVFEGFMDYLSYLTLSSQQQNIITLDENSDIIVLNSVSLISKALPFLGKYAIINCYLDNDKMGKVTFETIKGSFPNREVNDRSSEYIEYKDLNNFLMNRLKIIL